MLSLPSPSTASLRDRLYRLIGRETATPTEEEEGAPPVPAADSASPTPKEEEKSSRDDAVTKEDESQLPHVRVRLHPEYAKSLFKRVTEAERDAWVAGYALPGWRMRVLVMDH